MLPEMGSLAPCGWWLSLSEILDFVRGARIKQLKAFLAFGFLNTDVIGPATQVADAVTSLL